MLVESFVDAELCCMAARVYFLSWRRFAMNGMCMCYHTLNGVTLRMRDIVASERLPALYNLKIRTVSCVAAALVVVAGETKLMKLREFTRNKVFYSLFILAGSESCSLSC